MPTLLFAFHPPIPVAVGLLIVSGICGVYSLGLDGWIRDVAPERLFARTMTLSGAILMTVCRAELNATRRRRTDEYHQSEIRRS